MLAQAGVVDAGGAGYLLLLDALLLVRRRAPAARAPDCRAPTSRRSSPSGRRPAGSARRRRRERAAVGDLRYEVMYFLHAPDDSIDDFKEVWAGIGDSIVVVGGDGLWNCHIHTDDIGAAIEAALDARPAPPHPGHRPRRAGRGGALGPRERGAPGPGRASRGRAAADHDVVAVVTGDGIGRIFRSLGVHHLVLGRPVDEPLDRRPAQGGRGGRFGRRGDPAQQQEHPPGGRAGRRPERQDGAVVADRVHRRGLRRPARATTRLPTPTPTSAPWPSRRPGSCRPRSPGPCATPTTDAGRSRGRLDRLSRDGVVAIADSPSCARACSLARLSDESTSWSPSSRARGAQGGDTRRDHRVAVRGVPRRRGRGPPRGPAALPVPVGYRVAAGRSRAATSPGGRCRCSPPVSAPQGPAPGGVGRRDRPRPPHHLSPPLHRPHPSGRRGRPAGRATRRSCSPRCSRSRRGGPRNRRAVVEVVVATTPGRSRRLLQPALAGEAAEPGTEAIFWGKVGEYRGSRQMVNPVVDLVGRPRAGTGRRTLRILPDLPGVGEGRPDQLGDRHLRQGGPRPGR